MAPVREAQRATSKWNSRSLQGISHTTLGKLVAKHWNCPDFIADIAEFHHEPDRYGDGRIKK